MSGSSDEVVGDKLILPKFHDKSSDSFHLWKLRIEAILDSRNYLDIVTGKESRPADAADDADAATYADVKKRQEQFDKMKVKTVSIIINALGDKPLKTIQMVSKEPTEMWEKLAKRYASKTVNNKLSLLTEAHGKRLSRKGSMADHVGELETLFAKLDNAGHKVDSLMQVSILLTSLESHHEYDATIAAIRTLSDANTT
jgi:gag-polypeptide of LTR copia-type